MPHKPHSFLKGTTENDVRHLLKRVRKTTNAQWKADRANRVRLVATLAQTLFDDRTGRAVKAALEKFLKGVPFGEDDIGKDHLFDEELSEIEKALSETVERARQRNWSSEDDNYK